MPLSPERIKELRNLAGVSPDLPDIPKQDVISNRLAKFDSAVGTKTPDPSSFGQRVKADIKARNKKNMDILTGQTPESQGEPAIVRGFQATANTFGAIPDVASEVVKSVSSRFRTPDQAYVEKFAEGKIEPDQVDPLAPKVQTPEEEQQQIAMKEKRQSLAPGAQLPSVFDAIGEKLYELEKTHPEVAKNIESILKVAKASGEVAGTVASADVAGLGLNKVPGLGTNVAEIPGIVKTSVSTAKEALPGTIEKVKVAITPSEEKIVQRAVDAVNPELTGRKLTGAYKDIVTGKRTGQSASIFTEQKLSPGEQIERLGTRLKDTLTSKDPIKNLENLHKKLVDTETKIDDLFASDPELQYLADKPTLSKNLQEIKSKTPREFGQIRDSKAVYDNVIDFGEEVLAKADDTPKGLREARTQFDNQTRLEYPSAYKDGAIDTKTPAGRAIKEVRDAFNKHLYETAPNGSEIQRLIGEEADVLRAGELVAQKAAAKHGDSMLRDWIKRNPGKAKVIGLIGGGTLAGAGFEVAKAAAD